MKKTCLLSALLWLLLLPVACGKTDGEPHYYEIRSESRQLEKSEKSQFLLGQQYYLGTPVNILAEQSASEGAGSSMDVYIHPMGEDKKLLMSGVSREYRTKGWYLDQKGQCFITGPSAITRLDADGKLLYKSRTEDVIMDICCLEDGGIILLTSKDGLWQFSELDPDTGKIARIDKVSVQGGKAYIGASGKNLMLLNEQGFWRIDLKKGTKELTLPFAGTLYTIDWAEDNPADFWCDGSKAGILWSSGKEERLVRVDISGKKEIIRVRGKCASWLKKQLHLFNQSNEVYYVILEEPEDGDNESDFHVETYLKLTSGKGADIICSNAVDSDVSGLIEKGVFADLAPLMEASGILEENYFPAAFDAWRDDEKIYGLVPNLNIWDYVLDKEILKGSEELTIEVLVDSMLEFEEDRVFRAGVGGVTIMKYFLQGSEDLWEMVDWENGTCDFSGELFSKMLRAAKRYAADKRYQYPAITNLRRCMNLYSLDTAKSLEAKNQVHLGVFFDDGHYAYSSLNYGIAMGINAGSAHLEGAWELLVFLLNEEAQSMINYQDDAFPVNRNAFEHLIQYELEAAQATTEVEHNGVVYSKPSNIRFGQEFTEAQAEEIRRLFAEAKTVPYRVTPLLSIIAEETAYYFNGDKSKEEVVSQIQNRVQLYLDEHKTRK